jgi:Tfp pilus assembly protein PilO
MENLDRHSSKTAAASNESLQADLIQMDEDLARMLPKAMPEAEELPELQRIKNKIRLLLADSPQDA